MKVAIICFDFKESNLRKQPWRYVYEIAKGLKSNGHEVFIVTNSNNETDIAGIRVFGVGKLFIPLKGESKEVLEVLDRENPDRIIMLLGLTSFLRTHFEIKQPVIGVLTSPVYSLGELIRNVGIRDSIAYRRYTVIHIINSLVPSFLVRKWSQKFEYIIVLSQRNRERLIKKGVPADKVIVIPPGIDEEFLELPERETIERIRSEISPDGAPVVMYYTSPLTLRGTDTLVRALPHILKEKEVKLLILSRPDYRSVLKEEQKLRKLAEKLNVRKNLVIISKHLPLEDVKAYVSSADVVVLPFKLVLSDVPLSILEAMALGKVVIGTDVDGIPEILKDKGLIVRPNNPKELANAVLLVLEDKKLKYELETAAKEYVNQWRRWNDVVEEFLKLIG
ncbi:membrane-bound galactosyl-transferase [Thermococcus onnurineus NA1]|uniref:Membrane-bound galactosyl-transferase n=1 Tax=Thermococcus onnurineus (strain NA1) TaxID=523850 RepID=B6YVM4_THEON|nr:glycosyltransferase family 4 protein [Thermococcus onnurineus]ACJ17348.1 membrane-bound galactosyl-transferase [Thermococcus onnurineus NA1]